MKTKKTSSKSDSFETNLSKLQDIVEKMEEGKCNLDEALSMFEEGVSISKKCSKILNEYERKIMIVKNDNTNDSCHDSASADDNKKHYNKSSKKSTSDLGYLEIFEDN